MTQIAENAGKRSGEITSKIREKIMEDPSANVGYDALNDKIVKDMVREGIMDPVKVTRSALENAVSVGAMFLTTEAAVAELPEKKEKGMGGGMGGGMPHDDY